MVSILRNLTKSTFYTMTCMQLFWTNMHAPSSISGTQSSKLSNLSNWFLLCLLNKRISANLFPEIFFNITSLLFAKIVSVVIATTEA